MTLNRLSRPGAPRFVFLKRDSDYSAESRWSSEGRAGSRETRAEARAGTLPREARSDQAVMVRQCWGQS